VPIVYQLRVLRLETFETLFAVYGFLMKDRETLRRLKIMLNRLQQEHLEELRIQYLRNAKKKRESPLFCNINPLRHISPNTPHTLHISNF